MKEIKDDINRWRDIPCSWVGRINIVKMTVLPNAICRFNAIPIKLPMVFFNELEQKFHNSYGNTKTPNSQSSLEKEECSWRHQLSWLQVILLKLQLSRQYGTGTKTEIIDQWNKIGSPEINPCTYGYLIFDKGGKNIQWDKDSLFNKWCWENWTATCKRMKLEHFLTPRTKINSK